MTKQKDGKKVKTFIERFQKVQMLHVLDRGSYAFPWFSMIVCCCFDVLHIDVGYDSEDHILY